MLYFGTVCLGNALGITDLVTCSYKLDPLNWKNLLQKSGETQIIDT